MTNTSTPVEEAKPLAGEELVELGSAGDAPTMLYSGKKVWIDIDNSPHVPFFLPIIDELKAQGVELILTARNIYQVCELLEFFQMPAKVIGRHYGKNKFLKVFGNLLRTAELAPTAAGSRRPDLAISHGSRAQLLISKAMRIPTIMLHDYEHSTKTGFIESDWVMMPDVIPNAAMSKKTDRVLRYPGLKEDVYVQRFRPDPSILSHLGISRDELVVAVRPPATEAHYHNPESEVLFGKRCVSWLRSPKYVRSPCRETRDRVSNCTPTGAICLLMAAC